MSSFIDSLAQAIARMEGFFTPGTLAARNHNPGNLRSGVGQVGSSGGFAVFASDADGWAALDHQISLHTDLTLEQFFGGGGGYPGYAPSVDSNDPTQYAQNASQLTGIPLGVPISTVMGDAATAGDGALDLGGSPLDLIFPSDGGLSGAAWAGLAAAAGLLAWLVFGRG